MLHDVRDLHRRGNRRARGRGLMRIAYVCADPGVPVFGRKGCSVHVQEMLRALQGHGAGVDVFAARVDEAPPSGLESLRVQHLTPVGDGDPPSHAAAIAALNDELAALLDRAGPYDLVYERYSLWSFAAMEHAATAGVPGLLEVNAPLIEEQATYRGLRDAGGADLSARGLAGVVHCTEAVAPLEVPALLTSVDVAVAPYSHASGFYFSPLKVYEYMAAGRAVVASRVGQLEAVIRHDVNGLLCPPGDAAALAAALERLRCEPAVRARLGRAARATVLRKHTWDAVAARALELAAAVEV